MNVVLSIVGVLVVADAANVSNEAGAHCAARGGCDCDCSWATPSTCHDDDGSCCHACCCGSSPSPRPGPSPGPAGHATYCPGGSDFNVDYGSPQLNSNGWAIHGGARVSSKASYNFAGGFMEFDMDLAGAHGNVNNNFYLTFPRDGHSYCDSGGSCKSCCAEMDITENNGHCFQATTWHSDRSGGDHGGSAQTGGLSSQIHVKASWSADGTSLGVDIGGNQHTGEGFEDVMSQYGAVIYSSQWTGWVPGSCGGDGNLGASSFSVSNLKIQAKVVQGPEPTKCTGPSPTPPGPSPSPPSPTPPTGQVCQVTEGFDCVGGDLSNQRAQSEDECCTACKQSQGCEAFTFTQYDSSGLPNPTCYLKSSCASEKQDGSCAAGVVVPAPAPVGLVALI